MSTPANAYIEAREKLHTRIEAEISGIRARYRNSPGLRRAMVALCCRERRELRLLLWSYHNAGEPNRKAPAPGRVITRPVQGDNETRTS